MASDIGTKDETIDIIDSAGRSVELPFPVESVVVLWSNPAKEMRALGAIDRIVGMDQSTKDEVDKGTLPKLADVAVVGTQEEPNYERIAELKPDVVIALSASYPPEPDEIQAKLEPFGISVVSLDFYRTEAWFDEIEKLGRMLGKEERLKSIWTSSQDTAIKSTRLWPPYQIQSLRPCILKGPRGEYGIDLGLRDNYYTLPTRELTIQEIFVHSLDSAGELQQKLFCILFYEEQR